MASQVPESDVHKYEQLLKDSKAKLAGLLEWKNKTDPDKAKFDQELQQALGYCKAAFGIFRDQEQYQRLADDLADMVVKTRNNLYPKLMPLDEYHLFSRGIFQVNNQTVLSGQYYEEIPFYGPPRRHEPDANGPPQISKFYEWKIIDSPREKITGESVQAKCIYYLEKGDMNGVYHVLGYSAPGMHATVQLYQKEKPTFFQVEQRMIEVLLGQVQPVAASSFSSQANK